MPRQSADKS